MKVFKFGGGTLKNADTIRQMTEIVRDSGLGDSGFTGSVPEQSRRGDSELVVVISAFNKMTNAFEGLLKELDSDDINLRLDKILDYHREIAEQLLIDSDIFWREIILPLIAELKETLQKARNYPYDQAYDQVVSFGEIFSTHLISAFWIQEGLNHSFHDARKLIITDETYREGKVNWKETAKKIKSIPESSLRLCSGTGSVNPESRVPNPESLILTQGFIAGTQSGFSATLGREGSDYSAAIFGHILDVERVVIWKDVPGVLTADPEEFEDTCKMDEISYLEAVELSYFGAKIIHPNTIKPLQNKGIPLIVKSLFDPDASGTVILKKAGKAPDLPVIIRKRNQVLVSIQPRDFSFIVEDALANVFSILARNQSRINLMQHGAVSISLVIDWDQKKLDAILEALLPDFKVLYNTGLELLTIRHYTKAVINDLTKGKRIYVQQQSRKTARFVLG
ncbi:MAG: aspartate kinase [Bacteroidota bacterium]|nr:aspartate kinase [Bacteroidota bacterium]